MLYDSATISAMLQITVLSVIFYYVLLFFRGTRGAEVLLGLTILTVAMIGVTRIFNLDALNWLLRQTSFYFSISLIIIFQPEIRRFLAEVGRQPVLSTINEDRTALDSIMEAVSNLSSRKTGALIAIAREASIEFLQHTGVILDSKLEPKVLECIFFPHTPLHDGGVLIKDNRIVAAGRVFPLTHKAAAHKNLGTRHLAAIGLSEETDALIIVVSEETGSISVCQSGKLESGLSEVTLRNYLNINIRQQKKNRSQGFRDFLRKHLYSRNIQSDSKEKT